MSKYLSSAQAEEFDALVHHVYQADGKLRGAVTHRSGVTGGIYHFRTMGKGLANQKASQADVTPMDVAHTKVPCVLENWNAPEYTDIFDQAEVNFDEKSQLAKTIGMALRRREDQLIIDALDASTPTATIATSVGGAGTGLNLSKIRAALSALDNNGVPETGRCIISSSLSKATLLAETQVGSTDYNSVRALVNAEIDTFLGFKFIWVPANVEGGITSAATVYDGYAFHMDSVGLAVGIDLKTEINYVAEKTSWLCNGLLKAGAVAIDETGIVKIQSTQA